MRVRSFADLVGDILRLPGPVRLVSIDGPGGAGKSTFARRLAAARPDIVTLVHTDDFASADLPADWWPKLLDDVIAPIIEGDQGRFRRYDWPTRQLAEWRTVPRTPIVAIEGVSAGRVEWDRHLAYRIWIDTDADIRLARGLHRDGNDALSQWEEWMAAEDRHFARDPSRERADLVVDGNSAARHDPEIEFVTTA